MTAIRDGGAALAAATHLNEDLLVLEISKSDLHGIEVTRKIKEAGKVMAGVSLTGCTDVEVFHSAGFTGVLGYALHLVCGRICFRQ